jgi:cytochrome c-type biogenesis protein
MSDLSFVAAFVGGALMFLAPCTLPLVPTYLAFLGGGAGRARMVGRAAAFLGGFSSVIVAAGFFAGSFGKFITSHHSLLLGVGGVLFVISGLFVLGVIKGGAGRGLPAFFVPSSWRGVFVLGAVFSLAWSPCIGPVLGAVYTLAASKGAGVGAMLLLMAYVAGYSLPFLALAFFYERAENAVAWLSRWSPVINRASGGLLIIIGFLMIFGKYASYASVLSSVVSAEWTEWLLNYL